MLNIFSEEQGSCDSMTVAIVCHVKEKLEIRSPKAGMIVAEMWCRANHQPTWHWMKGICAVWWVVTGAELAEQCMFPEGKCTVRSVVWLFLYLPHLLECQRHLFQVLFSKQSLGNRSSVINAFNCENTVRSGKQEQLLSDMQLHPSHHQAFQELVKLMQPHYWEGIECDKSLSCYKAVQCLSLHRCGLLEESIKLMNSPRTAQEKEIKVPERLTIVILVAQWQCQRSERKNELPSNRGSTFVPLFFSSSP